MQGVDLAGLTQDASSQVLADEHAEGRRKRTMYAFDRDKETTLI